MPIFLPVKMLHGRFSIQSQARMEWFKPGTFFSGEARSKVHFRKMTKLVRDFLFRNRACLLQLSFFYMH